MAGAARDARRPALMLTLDVLIERGLPRQGAFRRHVRIEDASRVIALSGHSGAGKTSVLHAIAGLVTPRRGRIEVDGRVLFDSSHGIDLPAHAREVGYVFQDARLFPHLDVRGNLRYGRRKQGATKFTFDVVVALLGIGALLRRRTDNLSGGEAQRVAIGRALLSQPRLLLLDEPLSMLDHARRAELIPYLQRVRDETALPIVYVSHSLDEVRQLTAAVHTLD
jgi:molybdate transport system ATP-binding protein